MWSKPNKNSKRLTGQLRRLEARLESLIEGTAARFFPTGQTQHELAQRLVEAMRQGIQPGPDSTLLGPNLFVLEVNPEQATSLAADTALLDGLTRTLQEEGAEAGLSFNSPIAVRLKSSPESLPGQIYVQAFYSQVGLTGTTAVDASPKNGDLAEIPGNAFLIVDGVQVYPLRQAVVNIGRRSDNHLVIDDMRISRVHAQLRAVRGQFVIFDLDSAGGTWVNGERIRQQALLPGDVISLSGLPLVYGQDSTYSDDTQKMPVV
jgi:hypothetical protein